MQPWRPDLSWVLPDLAIGADFPPGEAAALARAHGLGAVIDLRQEACDRPEELAACGLKFLHLPTPDLCGVTQRMLDRGVAFARRAARTERRLLVHCRHGIGRSATLVLCILVDRGHAPIDALRLAKDAREKISPSEGQYQAWAEWIRRRAPQVGMPSYHEFGCIAYRHLVQPA